MSPPIGIRNGVRETENLVIITVVILQNHIRKDVVFGNLAVIIYFDLTLAPEHDGICVHKRLVFTQLNNEFLDPARVEERGGFRAFRTLVDKVNCKPGIEEGQLTEAITETTEVEGNRINENRRIREECDCRAGIPGTGFTHHFERFRGLSSLKGNRVDFTVPPHRGLEPIRESIHTLRTHSMKTP